MYVALTDAIKFQLLNLVWHRIDVNFDGGVV